MADPAGDRVVETAASLEALPAETRHLATHAGHLVAFQPMGDIGRELTAFAEAMAIAT